MNNVEDVMRHIGNRILKESAKQSIIKASQKLAEAKVDAGNIGDFVEATVKATTINLGAKEWGLSETTKESEDAAKELNDKLVELVNKNQDRLHARKAMLEAMEAYSQFGATESEPIAVLDTLLDYLYR